MRFNGDNHDRLLTAAACSGHVFSRGKSSCVFCGTHLHDVIGMRCPRWNAVDDECRIFRESRVAQICGELVDSEPRDNERTWQMTEKEMRDHATKEVEWHLGNGAVPNPLNRVYIAEMMTEAMKKARDFEQQDVAIAVAALKRFKEELKEALSTAAAEEREACAGIADRMSWIVAKRNDGLDLSVVERVCKELAKIIRSRALLVAIAFLFPAISSAQWHGTTCSPSRFVFLSQQQVWQFEMSLQRQRQDAIKFQLLQYAREAPTANLWREKKNPDVFVRWAAATEINRRLELERSITVSATPPKRNKDDSSKPLNFRKSIESKPASR